MIVTTTTAILTLVQVTGRCGSAANDDACPRWPGESWRSHLGRFYRFETWSAKRHAEGRPSLGITVATLTCGHPAWIYADDRIAAGQACVCRRHGMTTIVSVDNVYDSAADMASHVDLVSQEAVDSGNVAPERHLSHAWWGGW